MHTAEQLRVSMFDVEIEGDKSTREKLFPNWLPNDRLGVVVTEPLGGVGASLLIQLAITAFYDARPDRRDPDKIHYPDFYLFHAGDRFGDHSLYDFWPPRKEVFVGRDPSDLLGAINDKGITRLAVPEGAAADVEFEWLERESARDRIASAWVYSSSGFVTEHDVELRANDPRVEENAAATLEPDRVLAMYASLSEKSAEGVEEEPLYVTRYKERLNEVDPGDRALAVRRRKDRKHGELATETYRRVAVDEALGRL